MRVRNQSGWRTFLFVCFTFWKRCKRTFTFDDSEGNKDPVKLPAFLVLVFFCFPTSQMIIAQSKISHGVRRGIVFWFSLSRKFPESHNYTFYRPVLEWWRQSNFAFPSLPRSSVWNWQSKNETLLNWSKTAEVHSPPIPGCSVAETSTFDETKFRLSKCRYISEFKFLFHDFRHPVQVV